MLHWSSKQVTDTIPAAAAAASARSKMCCSCSVICQVLTVLNWPLTHHGCPQQPSQSRRHLVKGSNSSSSNNSGTLRRLHRQVWPTTSNSSMSRSCRRTRPTPSSNKSSSSSNCTITKNRSRPCRQMWVTQGGSSSSSQSSSGITRNSGRGGEASTQQRSKLLDTSSSSSTNSSPAHRQLVWCLGRSAGRTSCSSTGGCVWRCSWCTVSLCQYSQASWQVRMQVLEVRAHHEPVCICRSREWPLVKDCLASCYQLALLFFGQTPWCVLSAALLTARAAAAVASVSAPAAVLQRTWPLLCCGTGTLSCSYSHTMCLTLRADASQNGGAHATRCCCSCQCLA